MRLPDLTWSLRALAPECHPDLSQGLGMDPFLCPFLMGSKGSPGRVGGTETGAGPTLGEVGPCRAQLEQGAL